MFKGVEKKRNRCWIPRAIRHSNTVRGYCEVVQLLYSVLPYSTDTLACLPTGRAMVLGSLATARRGVATTPPQHQPRLREGGTWKPDKMPRKAALRLHTCLPKARTCVLTQIRTGKIGLAAFLHRCRVPGFEFSGVPPVGGSGKRLNI